MRNGFKVVDADAHFYEPADIWDKYVEQQYQDRCPKVVDVLGNALFEYEDAHFSGSVRAKTLLSQMESKFGHAYHAKWSMESRLVDMESEGWDIQVCLPTNGTKALNFPDPEVSAALSRAYNTWAHEFSSSPANRVKFTAVLPGPNIEEMIIEARRAVESLGAVSVMLPSVAAGKMWHDPDYTPLWEAAQELEFPVSLHGANSGYPAANARYDPLVGAFIALHQTIGFPFENMISLGHFMYSGILDKFPRLKLLVLEANSGWVPFWLNRLEKYCEGRQSVFFDEHPLDLTPQEYFLRQCAVAADADEPSIKYVVDYIGDDNIVFNTDYPHPDAPATNEPLANMMEQPLSEDTKRKILWDNSVKIYGERLVAGVS